MKNTIVYAVYRQSNKGGPKVLVGLYATFELAKEAEKTAVPQYTRDELKEMFPPYRRFEKEYNKAYVCDEQVHVALPPPSGSYDEHNPYHVRDTANPAVFHNGYCWQYDGEECQELGFCMNPACRDPMLDPNEDRTCGISASEKLHTSNGRYWGSSTKSVECTCGEWVPLT